MTERDALMAHIIANPADDTVRLVFADWCDENGEGERGALIRRQIETGSFAVCATGEPAVVAVPRADDWPPVPNRGVVFVHWQLADALSGVAWTVRRGFAEGVTLSAKRWAEAADGLIQSFPIQSVELTTYPQILIRKPWKDSEASILGCVRFVPVPTHTAHPGHILHALWPSIPLAGWTLGLPSIPLAGWTPGLRAFSTPTITPYVPTAPAAGDVPPQTYPRKGQAMRQERIVPDQRYRALATEQLPDPATDRNSWLSTEN